MWMSMISDGHDIYCGCPQPFAHLLDSIFPEGHTDRDKPISYIIKRDYKACLSGGDEETNHGIPLGGSAGNLADIKEENGQDTEGVDDLLMAAAAAAEEEQGPR